MWTELSRKELLDVRLSELGLRLGDCWANEIAHRVCGELKERGLTFRPHFWLSDEWFSPENIPGVALPFYLAHPRLMRLERRMMLEVEGGTKAECAKLMRHEIGHAIQHAFALHRRRRWREIFGSATTKYPEFYRPRPGSRRFVQHLDGWYAQSHPVEDFAETFAVWLGPSTRWRRDYAGWPALKKLMYVDELMEQLAGHKPTVRSRAKPYSLGGLKQTLGEHYERRQAHFRAGYSPHYDRDLCRIFSNDPSHAFNETAAVFLRRHRRTIRQRVARFSGENQFTLDQVLKETAGRAKELGLRVRGSDEETLIDFALMLTAHTVHTLHRGNEWHPM